MLTPAHRDETYTPEYFTAREAWRDWQIEARVLIRLARVGSGARVLEIGCGGGGLLRLLRAQQARAVGIDTLAVALHLAHTRQENSTLVQVGEDVALPFRTNTFDVIIGQHVVEHLPNVQDALCEWKRLLAPGGRIALATPNALYPDPGHFADDDHTHIFSPRELSDLVAQTGFVVESRTTIFPFLSQIRLLRAMGVAGYQFFQRLPYWATHGRTIILSAKRK